MRALLVVVFVVAGCGGDGAADVDARVDVDVDARGDGDAAVSCCPIATAPSCDCFQLGGSVGQPEGCGSVCDAPPVGWTQITDANGCPKWVGGAAGSCLPTGGPDTIGDSDSSVDVPSEVDAEVVDPHSIDPIFGWAGSIAMVEQLGSDSGQVSATYVLVSLASAPPIAHLVLSGESGACRVYTRPEVTCEPACTLGARCGSDGQCQPEPSFVSAGDITFSGLSAALVAHPSEGRYSVTPEPSESELFAAQADIGVSAAGADQPAFSVHTTGVSNLAVTSPLFIELYDTDNETITWTPDGSDAEVEVTLQLGWHGAPATSILFCRAPDADGHVLIDKALIRQFDYFGGTGLFQQPSWAERLQRVAIDGTYGPIEVVAASRVSLYVSHAATP